jgi:hypothetical protein
MRKKFGVGFGLVAVVLAIVVPPFVALSLRPYEPPVRLGMTDEEVIEALGEPDKAHYFHLWPNLTRSYHIGPDFVGNHKWIMIHSEHGSVTKIRVDHEPRTRPPWLDTALKWVGW